MPTEDIGNVMSVLRNNGLSIVCLVLLFSVVSCDFGRKREERAEPHMAGVYCQWNWSYKGNIKIEHTQYVILTRDSLYANVMQIRDDYGVDPSYYAVGSSANELQIIDCVWINRWHQSRIYDKVVFEGFVPIGEQWLYMEDSEGRIKGKDKDYIYEHGIECVSHILSGYDDYLFYHPDYSCFYKYDVETLIEKGIVPSNCESASDVLDRLCLRDSSIFEGVRWMSASELNALLWGTSR